MPATLWYVKGGLECLLLLVGVWCALRITKAVEKAAKHNGERR